MHHVIKSLILATVFVRFRNQLLCPQMIRVPTLLILGRRDQSDDPADQQPHAHSTNSHTDENVMVRAGLHNRDPQHVLCHLPDNAHREHDTSLP